MASASELVPSAIAMRVRVVFFNSLLALVLVASTGIAWTDTAAASLLPGRARASSSVTFNILHYNDVHGHIAPSSTSSVSCNITGDVSLCYGGFGKLIGQINAIKAASPNPSLVLDVGDQFTGTLYSIFYEGREAYLFQNSIPVDVMTFGNHEFDKGPGVLAHYIRNLTFPTVSCNIQVQKGDPLYGLIRQKPLIKWVKVGRRYVRVGFVGWTTTETKVSSSPGDKVNFTDPVAGVQKCVKYLKQRRVKIIIGLGHAGATDDGDFLVAKNVPELDLVVGGHSHTLLWNNLTGPVINPTTTPVSYDAPGITPYPYLVDTAGGGKVPYVQAFWGSRYLGNLSVTFNKAGVVTAMEGLPILLGSTKAVYNAPIDSFAQAAVANLDAPLALFSSTVIGHTNVQLVQSVGSVRTIRLQETNLGNIVADAMLNAINANPDFVAQNGQATIVLTNGGGIRVNIDAGDITLGAAYTCLPFGNVLTVKKVKGSDLKAIIAFNADQYTSSGFGGFLQPSGLYYALDPALAAGSRLLQVGLKSDSKSCITLIDDNTNYNVVTNEFTGNGGDGFTNFKISPAIVKTGDYLVTAFTDYLKANNPIVQSAGKGRIYVGGTASYTSLPTCT